MNDPSTTTQSIADLNAKLREENEGLHGMLDDVEEHEADDDRIDAGTRDLLRSQAIALLSADHESTAIDLSLATAVSFALRRVKRNWDRPSRQEGRGEALDLDGLLANPMVQQVIAKVTGMGAVPEGPLPDAPNLTVVGPQNTVLVVKRGEAEVSRRVIPSTGTRSLRLAPALYVVEVYPPSCTVPSLYYADLIDDAVTIDVHASMSTPAPETIVPDAPATPAGELSAEEAVPS